MDEIEPYCDSDEEVFFGPVTEKERKIAENLRKRAMINRGFCSSASAANSQDGEEGLHTLAMAAQMLSLSSSNNEECQEKITEGHSEEYLPTEYCTVLPPMDTITQAKTINTNEGSRLELDAVKFLSRHIPEQNQSESFSAEEMGNCHETPNINFTSNVSCVDNEGNESNYWSHSSDLDHMIDFNKYQNEAERHTIGNSITLGEYISNVKVDYLKEETKSPERIMSDSTSGACVSDAELMHAKIETKNPDIPELDYKYDMLGVKLNCLEWEDANEISKVEFGIKLSDNEEEIEKVERNLKVEEIIKFLADEDDSSKVKVLSEGEIKPISVLVDGCLPDPKLLMSLTSNLDVCTGLNDQLSLEVHQDPIEQNVVCKSENIVDTAENMLRIPKEETFPIKEECEKVNEVSDDKASMDKIKEESKEAHRLDSLGDSEKKTELRKGLITEVSIPSDSARKPLMASLLKKPLSYYKQTATPKVTPGMEKRKGTPRPSRTPNTGTDLSRLPTQPLMPIQSLALDTASSKSCARSLLQETGPQQAEMTPFKTPNSKVKYTGGSKIPQLCPFTPSPKKNKKFTSIVSPVSQYIHSKPVVLIANKKPVLGLPPRAQTKCMTKDAENNPFKTEENVTPKLQSLPDVLGERGAENVDTTNYSTLPEVSFKSALPLKIVSDTQRQFKSALPVSVFNRHTGKKNIPKK